MELDRGRPLCVGCAGARVLGSRGGARPRGRRDKRHGQPDARARVCGGRRHRPDGGGVTVERLAETEIVTRVRSVIRDHARLPVDVDGLADDADLFQAGMTSHASVSVMLALEEAFDLEFPDSMLTRRMFESIASITSAVRT